MVDKIFAKQYSEFILNLLYCIMTEENKSKQIRNGSPSADAKEIIDILHDKDNDISKRCRLIKLTNKHKVVYPKDLELLSGSDLDMTLALMCTVVELALFELVASVNYDN